MYSHVRQQGRVVVSSGVVQGDSIENVKSEFMVLKLHMYAQMDL